MKTCRDCGEIKPLTSFNKQREVRDGRSPSCKSCENARRRTPEHRAKMRAKYRNPRRWKQVVVGMAKVRARAEGVPFDLSAEDIDIPEVCPVLGMSLVIGSGAMSPNTPTLDRLVPSAGYVRGNVIVISWLANKVKSNITDPAIFEKVAKYMRKNPWFGH